MAFQHLIRVTCEQCGKWLTVNTGDTLEADRILARRGWKFVDVVAFYGITSHACSESCAEQLKQRIEEAEQSNPTTTNPRGRDE
jgi:hypothetical protein